MTDIIKFFAQVIVFVFGLFGGFLLKITPPQDDELKFALGISQMTALLILIAISVLTARRFVKNRNIIIKRWTVLAIIFGGIFLASSFFYKWNFDRHTIRHSKLGENFIRGTVMQNEASKICDSVNKDGEECISYLVNEYYTVPQIVDQYKIWDRGSVLDKKYLLFVNYVLMVIFFSSALFALIEIYQKYIQEKKPEKPKPGKKKDNSKPENEENADQ